MVFTFLSNKHCNCTGCICKHGGKLLRETWGWLRFCLSSCFEYCVHGTQVEFPLLLWARHAILLAPLISPGEEDSPWEAPSLRRRRRARKRGWKPLFLLALSVWCTLCRIEKQLKDRFGASDEEMARFKSLKQLDVNFKRFFHWYKVYRGNFIISGDIKHRSPIKDSSKTYFYMKMILSLHKETIHGKVNSFL